VRFESLTLKQPSSVQNQISQDFLSCFEDPTARVFLVLSYVDLFMKSFTNLNIANAKSTPTEGQLWEIESFFRSLAGEMDAKRLEILTLNTQDFVQVSLAVQFMTSKIKEMPDLLAQPGETNPALEEVRDTLTTESR
jgi:hypothetical protein